MRTRIWTTLIMLCVMSSAIPAGQNSEPTLTFYFPDENGAPGAMRMRILTLSQIKKLPTGPVAYNDPLFGKPKTYLAVKIKDLFDYGFGPNWRNSIYSDVEFTSTENYKASALTYTLRDDGGYLAIQDLRPNNSNWEEFPSLGGRQSGLNPGPFYLLWEKVTQSDMNDYLWFWQMNTLKLMRFEEKYPKVLPLNAVKGTEVHDGYLLFRDYCVRCHSIDRQGGKIGPDLGAPKNITSYRPEKDLFGYIKKASSYRYTKMPDFDQTISDEQIKKVLAYLKAKAKDTKGS